MADARFFQVAGPFTLGQLADLCRAELSTGAKADQVVVDVASLENAESQHISFLDNRKYLAAFAETKAGAVIVHPDVADRAPAGVTLLLSKDPYRAYAMVAQAFYPASAPTEWRAPTAWIDPSAQIGADCWIGPGAVIGANAEIGARCRIEANAVIGDGVVLGEGGKIGANASVCCAIIGRNVSIYPGARIGQDGFGFAMGAQGHLKVPQLGRVVIGDNVEIGANTTIDRGAGPDTVIGDGCWIDNLVQIGHNVQLGRGCVVVAQVGISGSTQFGDFVAAGGQVGFAGHLKIGMGAKIMAQSGVIGDIPAGQTYGGYPAVPRMEWLRQQALLSKLARDKKQR
ncbi:UDP-3-O-(3-hydroxymyristoyl)glucosamine N-acyltransferase [Magnetospirillum sp. 64-120]|uniref:UDP-3-O-(3-hydroxymyristoyl)glucosamine N-acyltransferase n=1 Tax=Magnetospirillum sp. 64-120 TaxID=1895778 RepID=UPI000926C605|nr:UDP-3-O-(3-hydroxymyristoyl)glucosamine N-acyltransferase [Magnetospirillum sp. 64-120]OJX81004.1 MAG: UDP-3-O-(3-hydroxymyristoyl)glucosamine N-acyltransferase [Magnetospirillum sp. 64-120]